MKTFAAVLILTASTGLVEAALIASEGFFTFTDIGYSNGNLGGQSSVNSGNLGFTVDSAWQNATGLVRVSNTVNYTHSGLTPNNGVDGGVNYVGMAMINGSATANLERNSTRALAATPVSSPTYFLSGLVTHKGAMYDGDYMSAGMGVATALTVNNITKGFHFGLSKAEGVVSLSAFAGGNIYTLAPAAVDTTYQIVLRLDVNASGLETLTAWYAENHATQLTQALSTAVESWSAADDLRNLNLQSASPGTLAADFQHFDEIRFGTTMASVTAIPEPGTLSLFGIGLLLSGLAFRRKK